MSTPDRPARPHPRHPHRRRSVRAILVALAADLLLVLVFVLIGRGSHDERPLAGAIGTFWPFAVALLLGWLVARAWRDPGAPLRTGVPVWALTVAGGMVLRIVADQGVQPSFVIVTALVLAAFLVGWRAVVALVRRLRGGAGGLSRAGRRD